MSRLRNFPLYGPGVMRREIQVPDPFERLVAQAERELAGG